jgi:hypothetical protein
MGRSSDHGDDDGDDEAGTTLDTMTREQLQQAAQEYDETIQVFLP